MGFEIFGSPAMMKTHAGGTLEEGHVGEDLSTYYWSTSRMAGGREKRSICIKVTTDKPYSGSGPAEAVLEISGYERDPSGRRRLGAFLTNDLDNPYGCIRVYDTEDTRGNPYLNVPIYDTEEDVRGDVFEHPIVGRRGLFLVVVLFEDFEADSGRSERVDFCFEDGARLVPCLSRKARPGGMGPADMESVRAEYEDFRGIYAARKLRFKPFEDACTDLLGRIMRIRHESMEDTEAALTPGTGLNREMDGHPCSRTLRAIRDGRRRISEGVAALTDRSSPAYASGIEEFITSLFYVIKNDAGREAWTAIAEDVGEHMNFRAVGLPDGEAEAFMGELRRAVEQSIEGYFEVRRWNWLFLFERMGADITNRAEEVDVTESIIEYINTWRFAIEKHTGGSPGEVRAHFKRWIERPISNGSTNFGWSSEFGYFWHNRIADVFEKEEYAGLDLPGSIRMLFIEIRWKAIGALFSPEADTSARIFRRLRDGMEAIAPGEGEVAAPETPRSSWRKAPVIIGVAVVVVLSLIVGAVIGRRKSK